MHNITSALVTTTLVFMAVFVPVCFIGGVTGTFYTQFGLTMAIAVGISLFNALTLSPALCALIMTPHAQDGDKLSFSSRFHMAFDAAFQRLITKYKAAVEVLFRHRWLSVAMVLVAIAGLSLLMKTTKTGLVPSEDMGTVFINIQASPGTNLQETFKIVTTIMSNYGLYKALDETVLLDDICNQAPEVGREIRRMIDKYKKEMSEAIEQTKEDESMKPLQQKFTMAERYADFDVEDLV